MEVTGYRKLRVDRRHGQRQSMKMQFERKVRKEKTDLIRKETIADTKDKLIKRAK